MFHGTRTPAAPSQTWELGHLSPAMPGKGLGEGLAFLSKVRGSSSAKHCSKCHPWDPWPRCDGKCQWDLTDRQTDAAKSQQSPPRVRVALLGPWSKTGAPKSLPSRVAWQLMLTQAIKVVQELGHLFHCPAPGGICPHPQRSPPIGKINEPWIVPC